MKIDLTDEQFTRIVSDSIMRSLDEKSRDKLVSDAIAYLIEPNKSGSYGHRDSVLVEAFRDAVRVVAREICAEYMRSDAGVQAKIRSLIADASERVFVENRRDKVVEKLAEAMMTALTSDRY